MLWVIGDYGLRGVDLGLADWKKIIMGYEGYG